MVKPLKQVVVDFPCYGEFRCRIFGHPEAITFPHHYQSPKGYESSSWKRLWYPEVDYETCRLENLVCRESCRNGQGLSSSIREDLEAKGEADIDMVRNSLDEPPSLYALAIGNKNGQTASCGTTFRASDLISMGEATGIPLACGLKLLIDGKITKFGVFAPEGVIDPMIF